MTTLYKILIAIAIVTGVFGTIIYQQHKIKELGIQLSASTINNKSYARGLITYADKNGTLHNVVTNKIETAREVDVSRDVMLVALKDSLKNYKIKLKNVTQMGQIETGIHKETQILFKRGLDTLYDLSDRPHITELIRIKGDSLTRTLDIKNTQTLIWSTHRETVAPPRKFFLWRWFQKKQNVTEANIVNSNPYIKTNKQDFIIVTK